VDNQRVPTSRQVRLAVEFMLVFFGLPLAIAYVLRYVTPVRRGYVIPILWVAAAVCLAVLLRDQAFGRWQLWNRRRFTFRLTRVLIVYVVAGCGLTVGVLLLKPKLFLGLVESKPIIWAMVMVLYPLLSVYPQEIIYRAFIFRRYREILPVKWAMITASAVSFGFMHVVFWNPVAVWLSLIGGILFAVTYSRTRSLLMASIEHSLYGCLIFTVGLGHYFFGTTRLVQSIAGG
jgi:CAAX protease family protein